MVGAKDRVWEVRVVRVVSRVGSRCVFSFVLILAGYLYDISFSTAALRRWRGIGRRAKSGRKLYLRQQRRRLRHRKDFVDRQQTRDAKER